MMRGAPSLAAKSEHGGPVVMRLIFEFSSDGRKKRVYKCPDRGRSLWSSNAEEMAVFLSPRESELFELIPDASKMAWVDELTIVCKESD